jgi:hypothetical protein
MYSDIMGSKQGLGGVRSPIRKVDPDLHLASNNWSMADLKTQLNKDYTKYSTKNQKHDQLKSTLDTH